MSPDSEPLQVFGDACSRLVEGVSDLRSLMLLLLTVTATAVQLPEVEPDTDDVGDDPPDLDHSTRLVVAHVRDLVGSHDAYRRVFDPHEEDEPVVATLTDDVGDVYRDIRRGLFQAEQGSLNEALWNWRFSFETHWGRHATGAICALYALVSEPL